VMTTKKTEDLIEAAEIGSEAGGGQVTEIKRPSTLQALRNHLAAQEAEIEVTRPEPDGTLRDWRDYLAAKRRAWEDTRCPCCKQRIN
jgi:hypothetical protein